MVRREKATGMKKPRMGPKIEPTRSKTMAMFVLIIVIPKIMDRRKTLTTKILLALSPFPLFLTRYGLVWGRLSRISTMVMMLKGTEKRGLRATKNFRSWSHQIFT